MLYTGYKKNETKCCTAEHFRNMTLELERRIKRGEDLEKYLVTVIGKDAPNSNSFLIFPILTTIYDIITNLPDETKKEELMQELLMTGKIMISCSYEEIIQIAIKTSNIIVKQQKQNSELLCEEILDIIDKNYMKENLSLTGISKELHVSSGYLSTIVKKTQGKTFISLLTAKRMKIAKEYLFFTSKKIREIASDCGYNDYHYFSNCFKKYYGLSPNKMREKKRNSQGTL